MHIDRFLQEFGNLWENFMSLLPKLILALAVFLFGLLIARLTEFLIKRMVRFLGQKITGRFREQIPYLSFEPSGKLIAKVFFWIIVILFTIFSTEILGLTVITSWLGSVLEYSPNILAAILIVFGGIVAGRILASLLRSVSAKMGIVQVGVLGKIVQYTVIITAAIIAVDQVGIDIVFLTQLVGIVLAALLFGASLAFGLGARTSVSNILASFYISKIYKAGDYVRIGDIEGRIIKVDSSVVLLDTNEGQVAIPAKKFGEAVSILIHKDK